VVAGIEEISEKVIEMRAQTQAAKGAHLPLNFVFAADVDDGGADGFYGDDHRRPPVAGSAQSDLG